MPFLLQSYQANLQFFKKNGPIFVNVNNQEGTKWIASGLVNDLARELGGALVTSDLRFQGRNSPRYITDEFTHRYNFNQLVGDVGLLVEKVRVDLDSPQSRVVVFGARETGTIAILARKAYPHLIDGAWSSGGYFQIAIPNSGKAT